MKFKVRLVYNSVSVMEPGSQLQPLEDHAYPDPEPCFRTAGLEEVAVTVENCKQTCVQRFGSCSLVNTQQPVLEETIFNSKELEESDKIEACLLSFAAETEAFPNVVSVQEPIAAMKMD
ncbi:hypothetical protein L596_006271 [Steinernema carpocapsae]|uniref:Uncharacterized protein n=1 Tax=Steinernema carpocapsae TaxID=34508 RepID=A0A4U8V358_STECR|nr:hypothetical protein L596_006271 [Steinernema carpocapsae]